MSTNIEELLLALPVTNYWLKRRNDKVHGNAIRLMFKMTATEWLVVEDGHRCVGGCRSSDSKYEERLGIGDVPDGQDDGGELDEFSEE